MKKTNNFTAYKIYGPMLLTMFLAVGCSKVVLKEPNQNNPPLATLTPTPTPNNSQNPVGSGPAPVSLSTNGGYLNPGDMGSCGNYVVMAETGISNVTGSSILGNIAVSPAAATYITGFALVADSTNQFSTSSSVTGKVYAADYAPPTPASLTSAIGNMEHAYSDAAGRSNPDFTELGSGSIGSLTLTPGLYKWNSSVFASSDVTISGNANDVWIFQITGDLSLNSNKQITLSGGALAKNIFWQVAGQVIVGNGAHFEGIILSKTAVTFQTLSSMNGRVYSQTNVAFDNNSITQK
jgi:hypothetical protein